MKTRCPACGAVASLDVLIQHEAARRLFSDVFRMNGRLGSALVRYLALFRPELRELTMDRVATLLGEIVPDITRGRITRHSREWPAPQEVWIGAIEIVLGAQLKLPLKGHGYLLEVIAGQANATEGKAEAEREQKRAYAASTDRNVGPAQAIGACLSPGHEAGVPPLPARERAGERGLPAKSARTPMPESVGEQLAALGITKRKASA